MKNINEIVTQGHSAPTRSELSHDQKQAVGYFFARLRVIYGHQYQVNFPDESTEKFAKREYARQVCDISREKMDAGFDALHLERQRNPEQWKFLELDKIIGLIKSGGQHWQQAVIAAKDREIAERPKALPLKKTPEQQERAAKAIAEMRDMLKNSKMGTERRKI